MAKKAFSYLCIVFLGFELALNYQLFVFPNNFAPAGLNGIFTMLQYLFDFKLSNANILINIPVAIVVFFAVSKPYATRAMVYLISFSASLMLLDMVDLSAFVYSTTISTLLGPVVAGMISGVSGYYMDKMGSCTGGTDFIAKLIHKKNPSFNFFTIIFVLNAVVACASYFVYDYKLEPVLLCIVYSFMSSTMRDSMARKDQSAIRCEIVTEQGEALCRQIIEKLHHSVTRIPGTGAYSGKEKDVLMCVLNPSQLNELTKLVEKFPGSFVTVSQVNTVVGNFKRLDSRNQPEKELLDPGTTHK